MPPIVKYKQGYSFLADKTEFLSPKPPNLIWCFFRIFQTDLAAMTYSCAKPDLTYSSADNQDLFRKIIRISKNITF